jgi:phosphoglycolate phosphatase
MQRFDLIVFDWDGTLIDSTATIARAIQAAAADLDLAVPSFERASHVIGLGLRDALAVAVPSLPPARAAEFSARYRYHYLAAEDTLALFAGAEALLATLKGEGLQLAVATGKNTAGLQRALAFTGLATYFSATRCADQTAPKPHPAMLEELCEELDTPATRTLMVGDTTHDLEMARAAGTASVAVASGAHPRDQLERCSPLAVLDSVRDLHPWMRQV